MAVKIKKSTKKKALVLGGTLIAGAGLGVGAYAIAYRKGWIEDPDQTPCDTDTNSSNLNELNETFINEGSLG